MAYEAFIQPGYSAVTTYVDCFGVEQTATLNTAGTIQVISICGLNTNPPVVVALDKEKNETSTFTLLPVGDC